MTFNPDTGFREDVTLPDVPMSWTTNLTDDEIREVYSILLEQRFFVRDLDVKKPDLKTGQDLTVGLGNHTDLEYKGRFCLIGVVGEHVSCHCRTKEEWNEVWEGSVLRDGTDGHRVD